MRSSVSFLRKRMASILLDFHNKLGDTLICNGIVREYAEQYDRVGVFCIPDYQVSQVFLFRDVKNIQFEMVKDQRRKLNFLWLHSLHLTSRHYDKVLTLQNDPETGIIAERQVYALAGLPHEKKWSSFYVERDLVREQDFLSRMAGSEPFIFVHDDAKKYTSAIDQKYLAGDRKVVRVDRKFTDNIFDYCTLLERAEEIHVVDSVFMFLADCLPYVNPHQKLFVHRYARPNPPWNLPVLKKNWTILT
jgi:hypothetical protein